MNRNVILQSMIASSIFGAFILAGGCQAMKKEAAVTCPKCNREVVRFHPKKGMTYKKIACPSCKTITVMDSATGTTTATHVCDACGMLVSKCPKCSSM